MSQRDDFSAKTRSNLAARAGWHCSFNGCRKLTIGPSDESSQSTACIGVAAHITAASRGGRRYDSALTPEERSSIDNGMWLCADHATLIDRDEVTYTSAMLHKMKSDHEVACADAVRSGAGAGADFSVQLFSVGAEIIFTGSFDQVGASSWILQVRNFLVGDFQGLVLYIDGFAGKAASERYILSTDLGDGRILSAAPVLVKRGNGYNLSCQVMEREPRIDVQRIGSSIAIHKDTNDIYLDERGGIARVSGVDYFPQRVREVLSMQRGENVFDPCSGVRFSEYLSEYGDTGWLNSFLTLEVIRQACLPDHAVKGGRRTPLQSVERVYKVELRADVNGGKWLPLFVDFDVRGIGRWRGEVPVYFPTDAQMVECKKRLEDYALMAQGSPRVLPA